MTQLNSSLKDIQETIKSHNADGPIGLLSVCVCISITKISEQRAVLPIYLK